MIAIVNYGMGNLSSIQKSVERLDKRAIITSNFKQISQSDQLILPGVGHFAAAMSNLKKLDLINVLNDCVLGDYKPILGICLGMQLMADWSEEGGVTGLGWIKSKVERFDINNRTRYKIPHMGWNSIIAKKKSNLLNGIIDNSQFYFVHSYIIKCDESSDVLTITNYEEDFVSSIEKNNIYGVQFHPEKSHDIGLKLIENFLKT